TLLALFLAHVLVYALALWLAAVALSRALARLPSRARGVVVWGAVAAGAVWAVVAEPYVTPFDNSARGGLGTALGLAPGTTLEYVGARSPTSLPASTATPGAPRAAALCAHRDPLRRPFFGDTHVHTALSFDAAGQGTRTTPREAYRFAQGE